jgi:hypothetical protein
MGVQCTVYKSIAPLHTRKLAYTVHMHTRCGIRYFCMRMCNLHGVGLAMHANTTVHHGICSYQTPTTCIMHAHWVGMYRMGVQCGLLHMCACKRQMHMDASMRECKHGALIVMHDLAIPHIATHGMHDNVSCAASIRMRTARKYGTYDMCNTVPYW